MQARQEIRPIEVMVADVVRETHDTATLVFFTGNDTLAYRAGHFLTIDPHQFPQLQGLIGYFEQAKGRREPTRAYSMSSAPHERQLAVTVKEEPFQAGHTPYPPLLSPLLVHGIRPGLRMTVIGFTGTYVLPDDVEQKTDHLVHVCAGSGIVPNYSILKSALHQHPKLRHTLLYGNKTHADIIFRAQLEALERAHPEQLRVVHALSREQEAAKHGPAYRAGRIDRGLLEELIEDRQGALIYACGPGVTTFDRKAARARGEEPRPRFLESVLAALAEMKVEKNRINYESYG